MRPDFIVFFNILVNEYSKLSRRGIFIRVYLLCFQTSEPELYHNVVCLSAFFVHTLPNFITFQQQFICCARELATLIRVYNCWYSVSFNRFFTGVVTEFVSRVSDK